MSGYEIHHGRVVRNGDDALVADASDIPEGSVRGTVVGTHWHGLLESDDFRRSFLTWVAGKSGRSGFVVAPATSVAALREQQLDLLADLVEDNVDVDAVLDLIEHGVDPRLDTIVSRVS